MKDSYILTVGEAADIRAIEKSMRRAWEDGRSRICPSHLDRPRFNSERVYGIIVENGRFHDTYYIVTADTMLRMMGFAN